MVKSQLFASASHGPIVSVILRMDQYVSIKFSGGKGVDFNTEIARQRRTDQMNRVAACDRAYGQYMFEQTQKIIALDAARARSLSKGN